MLPKGTADNMLEDADLRFLRDLRRAAGGNTAAAWSGSVTNPSGSVTNTVAQTAFSETISMPANTLRAGKLLRVTVGITFTNATVGMTLRIRIKAGGVTLYDGPTTLLLGVGANQPCVAELLVVPRTVGTAGSLACTPLVAVIAGTSQLFAATNATVNTTIAQTLSVTVQMSALGANTATLNHFAASVVA